MILYFGAKGTPDISVTGSAHLLKMQLYAGLWVIVFSAIGTFILLKLVGLLIPLRMSDVDMETGDLAVHGHEVYPSDVPSLGLAGHSAHRADPAALARAGDRVAIVALTIIVSYDGTENDTDALALGQLLAKAGGSLALAYVRHAAESDPAREAQAQAETVGLLEAGARWLGEPDVPRIRGVAARRRKGCATSRSARTPT